MVKAIEKRDGIYFYGGERCESVDDAYMRFRSDYHESVGRKAFSRLDRLGQRKERVHGFGHHFQPGYAISLEREFGGIHEKTDCRLLGLVGVCYCWRINGSDMPDLDEKRLGRWIDWALMKGSGAMRFRDTRLGRWKRKKHKQTK